MKRILIITDPLKNLNHPVDTSLMLGKYLTEAGYSVEVCEPKDVSAVNGSVLFRSGQLTYGPGGRFRKGQQLIRSDRDYNGILLRKEPPFNSMYLQLTYLLDLVGKTPVLNNASAVRHHNEKISALHYPDFSPKTLVSADVEEILNFLSSSRNGIVVKPVDEKWGNNIFRLDNKTKNKEALLRKSVSGGKRYRIVQEFVRGRKKRSEKRVSLLDGKILAAYEKAVPAGDFRGNLHRGGSYHKTRLTEKETAISRKIASDLNRKGIHFAGIDILSEKLLEINVTCPGAVIETGILYPEINPMKQLAQSVINRIR